VGDFAELKRAISELGSDAGMIVLPSPEATVQREQIIGLATLHRLPAVYPFKDACDGACVAERVLEHRVLCAVRSRAGRLVHCTGALRA
jgi:hypothetical protein